MHRIKAVLVGLFAILAQFASSPLLLLVARTRGGRAKAVFLILPVAALMAMLLHFIWPGTTSGDHFPFIGFLLAFALLVLAALMIVMVPSPHRLVDNVGPVQSHFLGKFQPQPVLWGDSEDDSVWMLVLLITHLEPFMSREERQRTRQIFRRVLEAMVRDPATRKVFRVSTVMSRRLLRGRLDPEHCYTYTPSPRQPGEVFGLLVFLHGHGTNILALLSLLRPMADRLRMVLLAPTFGYGNWEAPGGCEAIARAVDFALERYAIDSRRVFLSGLSQGGAGVSRAGALYGRRYAGLIFLSATMELLPIESQSFIECWKGRPVLVIQGERDHNVTPRSVRAAVESMRRNDVVVTFHTDAASGHFLFFARADETQALIADWVERAESTAIKSE